MNTEEKFYSAKMALKMIAAVKPETKWVATGYTGGHTEYCSHCTQMIQFAKFALQELGEENETKPKWNYLLVANSELGGCWPILVRYRCTKQEVSKDKIEDAISSYWEDCREPDTDEQLVEEVMSSFEGLEFEILPYEEIRY